MKKKIWIPIAIVVLLLILFLPIPSGKYKDGGSRSYTALTYKIVDWNRITGTSSIYDDTSIYFFPNNFKSIDELWEMEKQNIKYPTLKAEVTNIFDDFVFAEVVGGEEGHPNGKIAFSIKDLESRFQLEVNDIVHLTYTGIVEETYPARIDVIDMTISADIRNIEFTAQWLDEETKQLWEEKYPPHTPDESSVFEHLVITKIYSNCFFATSRIPLPYVYKINAELSDDWCVGDYVNCTYTRAYVDDDNRVEADMGLILADDWEPDPYVAYKPVIYFYPEEEIEVSVNLSLDGKLTCTYPAYNNGWSVTALPDGTLTDKNGQTYNYLYWEGETDVQYDLSKGFCVKGEDTAEFLEKALSDLGLNRREANEFIVYWLPLMEQNPYNIISFQTDIYTDAAELKINPAPDTLIRVFMAWQASDSFVDLPAQELTAPERNGFTVVEWGGTQITRDVSH